MEKQSVGLGTLNHMTMTSFESKTGTVHDTDEKIYSFLADFRNIVRILPPGRIKDWQTDGDSCRFTMDGLGSAGLKILEKEPFKTIKYSGEGPYSIDFLFWIQIRQVGDMDSRIRLTLRADLNPVMIAMLKNSVQSALDTLIDYMENINYSEV